MLRGSRWSSPGSESPINDVLAHQKETLGEKTFWFKSRSLTFDSRGLTRLTFSVRTSLLTYDKMFLRSGVLQSADERTDVYGEKSK